MIINKILFQTTGSSANIVDATSTDCRMFEIVPEGTGREEYKVQLVGSSKLFVLFENLKFLIHFSISDLSAKVNSDFDAIKLHDSESTIFQFTD